MRAASTMATAKPICDGRRCCHLCARRPEVFATVRHGVAPVAGMTVSMLGGSFRRWQPSQRVSPVVVRAVGARGDRVGHLGFWRCVILNGPRNTLPKEGA